MCNLQGKVNWVYVHLTFWAPCCSDNNNLKSFAFASNNNNNMGLIGIPKGYFSLATTEYHLRSKQCGTPAVNMQGQKFEKNMALIDKMVKQMKYTFREFSWQDHKFFVQSGKKNSGRLREKLMWRGRQNEVFRSRALIFRGCRKKIRNERIKMPEKIWWKFWHF